MVLDLKKLSAIVGKLKAKAAVSKATIFSITSTSVSPNLVVLNLTTQQSGSSPLNPRHVSAFLSFGQGSRLVASSAISALVSRLLSTQNPTVALKCLVVVHHVVHSGNFILQDQAVSLLHPKIFGGHNHLNLSGFRHGSWAKSSWVRWYGRFLEKVISTYKVVGNFNFITEDMYNSEKSLVEETEKVRALLNFDLLTEVEALIGIMEEIVKVPEIELLDHEQSNNQSRNRLVEEVVRLLKKDRAYLKDSISIRIIEIKERINGTGFGEYVELICLLRRLEEVIRNECNYDGGYWSDSTRELVDHYSSSCRGDNDVFRKLVMEVKMMVPAVIVDKEEKGIGRVRREGGSESARFVGSHPDSLGSFEPVGFRSTRWCHRLIS